MAWLLNLILRTVLLLAGLVAAASVAVAAAVLLAVWGLRRCWALLRGQPVPPVTMRWRRAAAPDAAARERPVPAWAPVPPSRRGAPADVTDVEPK